MRGRAGRFTGLLLVGLGIGCGGAEAPRPPRVPVFSAQSGYPLVAGDILEYGLARYPARATTLGEHEHDRELPPLFPTDLERARRDARALLTRLADVHQPVLERPDFHDYRVLEYALRAELTDLETVRGWQRDPVRYVRVVDEALDALYTDATLSPDARLTAAAARLRAAPLTFRAARQNLEPTNVPPLFARMAVEEAQELSRALRIGDGPTGAEGAGTQIRNEWETARRVAAASTDSFVTWLQQNVAPAARGDFRLGASALADHLRYAHHVTVPLETLQALNRQAIADYREWLEREALQFDPLRRPEEILDSIVAATPGAAQLIRPEALPRPSATTSMARRLFPASASAAAWAHFYDVDAIASEATPRAERLLGIARALHGHALLHGMLALHGAGATVDRIAEDIAAIAFIGRDDARREAERLAHDPGYGLPALGRMQLFALRERLRAERGGGIDATFAQTFLALALPVEPAAAVLLGREPGELLVVGQRTPGVPEPPRLGR